MDKLEAIQRRAARFILNRYHNMSSVSRLIDQLRWPSLEQWRKTTCLGIIYKIHHGLIQCPIIRSKLVPPPTKTAPHRFLISAFEGLSQLMGRCVSADGMSGGESGVGWFSSLLKCSTHRFSYSLVVVSGFPFLSFTGLSVCWNLPVSFLVSRYRSLRLPCPATVSAYPARSSM